MIGLLNRLLLKLKLATKFRNKIQVGDNVFIHKNPTFIVRSNEDRNGIFIHDGVYIGRDVNIHTASKIVISKNCVISDYVYISTLAHGIDPELGPILTQKDIDKGQIILGENVFLGFNTKILPGVTLGDWTIVGTGAVVTKSFPGFCVVAGNPARIIKTYNHSSHEWEAVNVAK
ncbi:acyltransferase [Enterobacter sp. 120016]|jgi:acetyltransferase-like isoleucine patch superfamily enzyme|uniref:acyltransferase n=1 Tax=Enterobacter sp. 120016 TaxID=2834878 RepID=UPI001BCBA188|nr:acyltransferase [Enterobacter sp. 120016]MBS7441486.1 acyltransferase [Enterobacter sp. 120016]